MPNTYSTLSSLFTAIANAIRAKTGSEETIVADNFPTAIAAIPTGTTAGPRKDVNLIDYDGTILHSYTSAEFANLTALPSNPSHDGLTAQGWNWSLPDAKTYVASYGKLNIGQMYTTSDGKTRIYIRLEEGRLAPYLGIAINGTATVDWGDGQTSTVTGSSTSTVVSTQHSYAAAGDYIIAIAVTGNMALAGTSSYGSQVLWKNSTTGKLNRAYQNAIQKVEIGSNTSFGDFAFRCLSSLISVTIPSTVTSIGVGAFDTCASIVSVAIPSGATSIVDYAFSSCYSLASVSIPSGVTSIGNYAFSSCYSLASVSIPSGVTSIGVYAFYSCYSIASVAIPNSVTSISSDAFENCYSLASITIPSGVTSISGNAFENCYSLASVTIPSTVTSISSHAFYYCFGLGFIKFASTTPPNVSRSNAWTDIPTDCIIYVPTGSLSAYTSAENYPSSSTYTYVEY